MAQGLMKKYIKLADGDFKKAWKLQKAAQKKRGGKKKTTRKKVTRKKVAKKKATRRKAPAKKTVTKKRVIRKSTKRKAAKMARKKKPTARRRSAPRGGKIQKTLMNGLSAAAGAVGAGVVANMIPLPDPRMKAALPIAGGIALAMSPMGRGQMMQLVSVGMVSAGALALVRQFAPQIPLLAGEDESLLEYVPESDEELALLGTPVDLDGESVDLMGEEYDLEDEEIDEMSGEFMTTADV